MSIQQSHQFVVEQSKAVIALLNTDPGRVEQAKQINAAVANIVTMERNMVMHRARERALENDRRESLPRLPEP